MSGNDCLQPLPLANGLQQMVMDLKHTVICIDLRVDEVHHVQPCFRFRTTPVFGLLGTGQYSQILGSIVIGGYFCSLWHPIWYRSDSSQHRPHDNHLDICGAAVVSRWWQGEWGGVECKLYIVIIIQFLRFYAVYSLQINTLLCYTVVSVSVLVLGIGIARGQYYWILGALLGIVLTLPSSHKVSEVKSSMGQSPLVRCWSTIQGPQPDTSRSCKTTDTGPMFHIVACLLLSFHRPVPIYTAWWQKHIGVNNGFNASKTHWLELLLVASTSNLPHWLMTLSTPLSLLTFTLSLATTPRHVLYALPVPICCPFLVSTQHSLPMVSALLRPQYCLELTPRWHSRLFFTTHIPSSS